MIHYVRVQLLQVPSVLGLQLPLQLLLAAFALFVRGGRLEVERAELDIFLDG